MSAEHSPLQPQSHREQIDLQECLWAFSLCLVGGVAHVLGLIGVIVFGAEVVAFIGFGITVVGLGTYFARRREDIIVRIAVSLWRQLPAALIVFGLLFFATGVFRIWVGFDEGNSNTGRAKADLRSLSKAAEAFNVAYGVYPTTLEEMVHPPTGNRGYVEEEDLLDPWGRPYDYDPSGRRNQGKWPDLWTVTPHGELIGNWMLKK